MEDVTNSRSRGTFFAVAGVAIVGVVIALVLAGGSHNGPTSTTSSTSTSSSSATTIPFNIKNNARVDMTTNGQCTLMNNEWVLSGSIKNSANFARKYQIIVDFVTVAGATIRDTKILEISAVHPGASVPWTISGGYDESNLMCIVRNVQAVASR